jgi:NADH-quinone oxidoreductase subunit G
MVNLLINGDKVTVPEGTTILKAAEKIHIKIPALCHLEGLEDFGGCRLCMVELEGEPRLAPSCIRTVSEGMKVYTNSRKALKARQAIIELLLANHAEQCPTCERSQNCELQRLSFELGVRETHFSTLGITIPIDMSSTAIIRDINKCISCGRCVRMCHQIQSIGAVDFMNRGTDRIVATVLNKGLGNVECVNCGQCIHVCPVGAIRERSFIDEVWAAIHDKTKHVVVQSAPSIRAALGEELGLPPGSLVTGKMYAALRRLGFDAVFDTNFTADLTIMEESTELIHRIKNGGVLPLLTSCCPGWVKFAEHFYPDLLPNISTCKSPQQMFGSLVKTYYARQKQINPETIVSVSIMPCTAKKFEAQRPEMNASGFRDVDYVLTTRELVRMIKEAGIDFAGLPDEPADKMMSQYSGAATIFGASGGVMEAALRTAYKLMTNQELINLEIHTVRGLEGIKEAAIDIQGMRVKVAVAHGLANARVLIDRIKSGASPYHFIEIMACPGGCVGGGGQPIGYNMVLTGTRSNTLYAEDKSLPLRRSHENPEIQGIYKVFLNEPLSQKSHELLHTAYARRIKKYSGETRDE